jgi:hypothetical protein
MSPIGTYRSPRWSTPRFREKRCDPLKIPRKRYFVVLAQGRRPQSSDGVYDLWLAFWTDPIEEERISHAGSWK